MRVFRVRLVALLGVALVTLPLAQPVTAADKDLVDDHDANDNNQAQRNDPPRADAPLDN